MRIFTILTLLFAVARLHAQIIQEHVYPFEYIQFSAVDSSEVKYYKLSGDTVDIFNSDHSVYKTVVLPKFKNVQYFTKVSYLTKHLFNTDDKLEFLLETYPINVAVINEDGEIIFECDHCTANYPLGSTGLVFPESIVNTEAGTKMFLADSLARTLAFSLPGKLPGSKTKSGVNSPQISDVNRLQPSVFPNPSSRGFRIEYTLPEGVTTGEIIISTVEGNIVKRYQVGNIFNDLLIDNSDLPSGTYFYKLVTAKGESEANKIVVLK